MQSRSWEIRKAIGGRHIESVLQQCAASWVLRQPSHCVVFPLGTLWNTQVLFVRSLCIGVCPLAMTSHAHLEMAALDR